MFGSLRPLKKLSSISVAQCNQQFNRIFEPLRPLNIAEAAGRTGSADAARTYAIARGSAMECAAVLDALQVLKLVDDGVHRRGIELLKRVVAMLTKMCR